jgi:hypothetical protein
MKYYKNKWNELRGDQFDTWGFSMWYFEIGEDDFPNRQIVIYENGKKLKYSQENLDDEYGGLGDQKLDFSEFDGIECTKIEFEKNWN